MAKTLVPVLDTVPNINIEYENVPYHLRSVIQILVKDIRLIAHKAVHYLSVKFHVLIMLNLILIP